MNDWLSNALNMAALTMIWIGGLSILSLVVVGVMKDTMGSNLKV